jgi:protein-disulfide isomerase
MAESDKRWFPIWAWLIVIAGFVLPPILITRWMEPETTEQAVAEPILDDPEAPIIGPADADVTIVIFTDYRCPICRQTEHSIRAVMKDDSKLRLMVKDWPILGPESRAAAEAAIAANWQGRYPAFHKALMREGGELDDARIYQIAGRAGVNTVRLASDRRARAADIAARLDRIAREALSLRLQGTPALLIGPYLVPGGASESQLRKLVKETRAASSGGRPS